MKYILASSSPRRRELLKIILPDFDTAAADIDETVPDGIPSQKAPEYLAVKKAEHVAAVFPDAAVIGADTAVFCGEEMLGKPKNAADAKKMLVFLSGKTHKVITGCAAVHLGECRSFSCVTEVTFFELSENEIEEYIKSGEPMDKAGAYGIQGKGSLFVKDIKGDYFNVVGLPLSRLSRHLNDFIKKQNEYKAGEKYGGRKP